MWGMVSAAETVEKLEAAIADLPPGAKKIKIDGLEAELDVNTALRQLEYWRSRKNKEIGLRPRIARIRLDG